jgi:ADP-ribose pyrophosphatase
MAERLLETPVFAIEAFPVETREGTRKYFRLRLPDWVNVACRTTDGRWVLIRQHRWGIDQGTLEVPGGVVEPGEDAGVAGLRELVEETGYGGGALESLGWVHPNPAIQDNRCHLFLLRDAVRIAEPHLDPGEDIEVTLLTTDEVRAALASGAITHALAALSLTRALAR